MTPHDLIAAFEDLADAPDGVKRLRELVLQLAVRGKLVPQDPNDEPASHFLALVAETKRNAGSGKSRRHAWDLIGSTPWELPPGWAWAPFGDTNVNRDGERVPVSSEERQGRVGPYDYYGASGVIDTIDGFLFDKPLLLIGEDGANLVLRSTPIAFIARGKYWVNNHAHVLDGVDEGSLRYLAIFINSIDLRPFLTGMAQPKLNQARMNVIPCAVPPLAEQHRIVARVDELMGLLDRLEAARTARDDVRRAARDAALAALRDADDADAVEAAWGRIAGQMDALFADPEDVGPLRQAVLGLAVRGRLVPTRPHAAAATGPFPVPTGWSWKTLLDLTEVITSGSRNWNQFYSTAGASFIRSQDIKYDRLEYDDRAYVTVPGGSEGTRTRVVRGDWLITITGANVGKCALLTDDPGEAYVSQHVALMRPKNSDFGRFGHIWLTAEHGGRGVLLADSYGAKPGLNLHQLRSLPVPVPPREERDRIVAKVDALLATCDALEARLTTARDLHAQFAAAAVHHFDV